jgi:hypothetical protein
MVVDRTSWVQFLLGIAAVVLALRQVVSPRRAHVVYALGCLCLIAVDAGLHLADQVQDCEHFADYLLNDEPVLHAECHDRIRQEALWDTYAIALLGAPILVLLGVGELEQRRRKRLRELAAAMQ